MLTQLRTQNNLSLLRWKEILIRQFYLMMKSLQNQKKNQRKLKYISNTLKLMMKNSHQKTEVHDPRDLRTNEGEVVDREIIIIFVKEDLAAAEKTFQKID